MKNYQNGKEFNWVFGAMNSIQVSDTCDASSILAGPASERVNTISDNSRKGV